MDKSFVGELTGGDRDSAIVAITEGRQYGYRLTQGYLFGRPMPVDDMDRHLRQQPPPVQRPIPAGSRATG